jgi:hypothetical protein
MITRMLKRALITSLAVLVLLAGAFVVFERPVALFTYYLVRHRVDIALKERQLANPRYAAALAGDLRQFAREQRWDHPEKTNQSADFYYENDSRLPGSIGLLKPSWVQISDERIDISCGDIEHEAALSFGLRVWRDPKAEGYGTKKVADGVWYYQMAYEYGDN